MNYIFWWGRPINEKQISVLNSIFDKFLSIIFGFIQPDYSGHIKMFEDLDVIFGSVSPPLKFINVIKWPHESNKLAWDDPVKISIFDLLVIFIFFVIKLFEIIPAYFHSIFQSFETVVYGAGIAAIG